MEALTTQQESKVYTLAAQMMAEATSDADTARIDRALDLVKTVQRMPTRADLFIVNSATKVDAAYHVHQGQCNCDDASKRDARRCKHAVAVQLFCQLERAEVDAEETTMLPYDSLPQIPTYSDHPNGIIGAIVEYLDPALYAEKFPAIVVRVDPDDSILDLWPGEPCDLPAQCSRCHAEPICRHHRDGLGMACIADELGMGV